MTRPSRQDAPGSWHHVMNRGIARRTVFETRSDVRALLAGIARSVRRGELEVHAFCVMATHYHLLVRSPRGQLSEALRRIQNEYVRAFNRQRRRDGSLFRGRFRSKPVESLTYRHILVRYIDANPVVAGLVEAPGEYPHGSARLHLAASGGPWLERSWIRHAVSVTSGRPYDARGYHETFGGTLSVRLRELVELRSERNLRGTDPLDDLVGAAPGRVLRWFQRKAALADGTRPGIAICDPLSVDEAVEAARERSGDWTIRRSHQSVDGWKEVHAGLLREMCSLSDAEVSQRLRCSESGARKMREHHRSAIGEGGEYAVRASEVAAEAMRQCGLG